MQYIGGTTANNGTVPALPAHNSGDLIIGYISGRYIGSIGDGTLTNFTLLGKFVGDTTTYIQVFAKIGTGSTTAPTVGGLSGSDSGTIGFTAWRPDSGYTLRDTIAASASWVVGGNDTDATANNLQSATTSAFASGFEPDGSNADAILSLAAQKDNLASALASATHSATGLSGGTHTARLHAVTNAGSDSGSTAATWTGFSGTPSTGITITHNLTSFTAPTGAVVAVAIRQIGPTNVSVGQATETDEALAATVSNSFTVSTGLPTETDSALALASVTAGAVVVVGQAQETDEAFAVEVESIAPITVDVGQATETDSPLTPTVLAGAVVSVGFASETDSALAVSLTVGFVVSVGQAQETDSALAVTVDENEASFITVGIAVETDTALGVTVSLGYSLTDTSNADDGVWLGDGLSEIVWEPDVVPPPTVLAEGRTVATVVDTPPGVLPDFTPAVARSESKPLMRERVLIGGVDFTYFRDVPVQVNDLKFIDPLLYGSGQITLPQVNPQYPDPLGDLETYFRFARVVVQLVLDGDPATIVVPDYWKGFVSRVDTEGHQLVLTLGGQAAGRLSAIEVRSPVYKRKQDVEHILVDTLRDARVRAKKHDGESGVGLIRRGGSDGLSIFNETLAVWAGATGSPITFTPNANGVYRKTTKDLETVHATAYLDSSLISQSLSQDFMEQPNRIYAQGWTADGELVTNIRTPGLTQITAPDFPNDDESPMVQGDEDEDTDSGAGVTAVQEQLAVHNFYDVNDGDLGIYDDTVAQAVEKFQDFAGLNVTGEVGINTWNRLWNLNRLGYSLDDAREYPMAEDPAVRKWNRTANGSKIEANPDYDPHVQPVDMSIDVGGPFPRRRIRDFAEAKLAPEGGVWVGQLTLRSGLVAGEHNPGDPFTSADVMDRRELLPNMNVWLPHFGGGLLVHVTGIDHGPEESTALVSTHPATTVETWAAIERLREAKSNPGRQWSGHVRQSQVRYDLGPRWDTSSGRISGKRALTGGEWTEVKVPAGQAGVMERIRLVLEGAAEFAVIITQKPLAMGRLNDPDSLIAYPLVDQRPSFRPWWEQDDVADWLEERGVLKAWGTEQNPCGYGRSPKTDDQGETAQPVTGVFQETAGFNYETGAEPVLYLYIWTGSDNNLMPGRVLRNQRTTDF